MIDPIKFSPLMKKDVWTIMWKQHWAKLSKITHNSTWRLFFFFPQQTHRGMFLERKLNWTKNNPSTTKYGTKYSKIEYTYSTTYPRGKVICNMQL